MPPVLVPPVLVPPVLVPPVPLLPEPPAEPTDFSPASPPRRRPSSSLAFWAYMSTYSWPDSSISSYMISSVTERRTNRSSSMPSYREKSSGLPIRTPGRISFGSALPGGCILSVPIMATGITGAPEASASRATPVLPL